MIMIRRLTLQSPKGNIEVPISVFLPEEDNGSWTCRYEIGWPDGTWSSAAGGVDSTQAVILALQKIGIEVYFSDYHKSGQLMWNEAGRGYGFPVPQSARDLLVGDDARFF